MFDAKRSYWRKLDNAAKIFPATSSKKDTRVFRFYCELKEQVEQEILQEAVNITIKKYPVFLSVMRKGLFWHYLERSKLRPVVEEEYKEPCRNLYVHDKKTLLFEVTYYKNRINFEVFHALTDGTGATQFLREVVKNYLYLAHREDGLSDISLTDDTITVHDQENDSFSKYYSQDLRQPRRKKIKAYQIRKMKKEYGKLQITEGVVSVKEVLARARSYGVSMTVYLTAVYICAIHREMMKFQERKPVKLMVPVNLRNFFQSDSMLNFFGWIEPGYQFGQKEDTLQDVIAHVKMFFQEELTKDKMAMHMNDLIALERNPLLRLAPLQLKNVCMNAGARLAEKDVSAIFSNMSIVSMPEPYQKYIERFGVFTSTPKMELCACSFGDTLSLGFTSRYDSLNIQRSFFRILKEEGIASEIKEPSYPEEKKVSSIEKKVFQWFTFLCIATVVLTVMANAILTPGRYWSLFAGGGIISMWLALAVGFFKRYNLLKNAMWQLLIVTNGCVIWDLLTGWHKWSVNFVYPAVSLTIMISMLIISKLQSHTAREYMIYFVMASGYGLLIPLILLLTGIVTVTFPSVLCVGFSFLFLMALVIFKRQELGEELSKKFHI